jgi:hypothetical protein
MSHSFIWAQRARDIKALVRFDYKSQRQHNGFKYIEAESSYKPDCKPSVNGIVVDISTLLMMG